MLKLFACYVGGRTSKDRPQSNIELHDIIFVVGEKIENCYDQIKSKWFGSLHRLHLDCYIELTSIDQYDIKINKKDAVTEIVKNKENELKLFFINCGGYKDGYFGEIHQTKFIVAKDIKEAIKLAKERICKKYFDDHKLAHLDDEFDIDDCMNISQSLEEYSINIVENQDAKLLEPVILGYHRI